MRNIGLYVARMALSLSILVPIIASAQECVDYGDYIHWVTSIDTPGDAVDVAIATAHAIIADGDSGLQIIDTSGLAEPQIVGSVQLGEAAQAVAISESLAFVAVGEAGLRVVDISEPTSPLVVGQTEPGAVGSATDVAVAGNHAYVTAIQRLHVLSVVDPLAPIVVGSIQLDGIDHLVSVAIQGDRAYVTGNVDGGYYTYGCLFVVDVEDPSNPVLLSVMGFGDPWGGAILDMAVTGEHVFVTIGVFHPGELVCGRLRSIAVSDPTSPVVVGDIAIPSFRGWGGGGSGVTVSGDRAFVCGQDRLTAIDITDPASLAFMGSSSLPGPGHSVAMQNGLALVCSGALGLQVVETTVQDSPAVLGHVPMRNLRDIVVDGSHAWAADGCWVRILNTSNPTSPTIVGEMHMLDEAMDLALVNGHLWVADRESGLRVYETSDPTYLEHRWTSEVPNSQVNSLAVSGGYSYAAAGDYRFTPSHKLLVFDISDPTSSSLVAELAMPGLPLAVATAGSYAYVACRGEPGSLTVVDIANPMSPEAIGNIGVLDVGWGPSVAVASGHAYVTSGDCKVIDVTDPTSPVQVAVIDAPSPADVTLAGNYAYIADTGAGLLIYDVTDPESPVLTGLLWTTPYARAVEVVGNYAYVASRSFDDSKLEIVDISVPTSPAIVGVVERPGYRFSSFALAGGFAYWAEPQGLRVIDVSSPVSPSLHCSYGPGEGFSPAEVVVDGQHAYIANGKDGLHVIDVSHRPPVIGGVETPGVANALYFDGGYAFVADGPTGLQVIDVSNPAAPLIVGSVDTPGDAQGVAVTAGQACVADGTAGLQIVDVSNPASPTLVGSLDTLGDTRDAAAEGVHVWLANGDAGIAVVDVSVPASPVMVASINPASCLGVTLSGESAYVACSYGVLVADVSEPDAIALIGGAPSPWESLPPPWESCWGSWIPARNVAIAGGYVYLAAGDAGLTVFPSHCEIQSAVEISCFDLHAADSTVTIAWQAANRIDHLGFHINRTIADRDRFAQINADLIRDAGASNGRFEFIDCDVQAGITYAYRLDAIDLFGGRQEFDLGIVTVGKTTPRQLLLHQNRPNPFNPSTWILFDLPRRVDVSLRIYDVGGRLVRTLFEGRLAPDFHAVKWDGRDDRNCRVPSGAYFYSLQTSGRTLTRKLVMLK